MTTNTVKPMTVTELRERPTVSVPQAGAALGYGPDAAYRQARAGIIPTIQIGRRRRVPTAALIAMLEGAE